MQENKRSFGSIGEDIAVKFLIENNYKIIARNYRSGRFGEIDIIAKQDEYICFIEVKTRTSVYFGMPSEAVTWSKQQTIRKVATIYLSNHRLLDSNVRFDVVEVIGKKKGSEFKVTSVNLIKNAF